MQHPVHLVPGTTSGLSVLAICPFLNSDIDQVKRYISLLNKASIDDCNVELISPGLIYN
uniref:Uncharacterized protein n=1 Tax=Rhizophagus irregularis (strain DAOM 181602 / DAOM 197198 / MUCL 43194) TaxID=747089 RepID=U9TWH8_RHIID